MFPDTCGIRLFLVPAVVVGQPLLADPFDHVAQQFDLGQQSVDVGLRYDELIVVTRLDIGGTQQLEQAFLLLAVARKDVRKFRRERLTPRVVEMQVVLLVAVHSILHWDRLYLILGWLMLIK